MIKAVIFDCFGVLTGDKWKEFVSSLPPEQKKPASLLNQQYDAAQLSKQEFLGKIRSLTGHEPTFVEQLLDSEMEKNVPLLYYIKTLKQKYKIGLLSNIATNWVRDSFLTKDEQELFDDMIFSFEVGVAKPNPKIFLLACEHFGITPEEAVIIDDSQGHLAGAAQIGMHTIWYQNFGDMKAKLEKLLTDVQA
jgi:HAD superfamily hydrolase (TIGR01509 family)